MPGLNDPGARTPLTGGIDPNQTPLATAAGGPASDGSYSIDNPDTTYYSQGTPGAQAGGVQQGNQSWFDVLTGKTNLQETPNLIGALPDIGDKEAYLANYKQYQDQHAAWQEQYADAQNKISTLPFMSTEWKEAFTKAKYLESQEPKEPDYLAIQRQGDRNRLLNLVSNVYNPAMKTALAQATGTGPSAALGTYQQASDIAQKQGYGLAATARGTGGQRAALFQAALGKAADAQQGAANDAAKIRMQEMGQGQQALGTLGAGVANIVGTSNLLGDTQKTQAGNQGASNASTDTNVGIKQADDKALSDYTKSLAENYGKMAHP